MLTDEELERYARHIVLHEVGGNDNIPNGQPRLHATGYSAEDQPVHRIRSQQLGHGRRGRHLAVTRKHSYYFVTVEFSSMELPAAELAGFDTLECVDDAGDLLRHGTDDG